MPIVSQRPCKWLFVIGELGLGGAEHFLLSLATQLRKRGHQVTVLTLRPGGPLNEAFLLNDIPITEFNVATLWDALRAVNAFSRIARRTKPDVIVGWMYYGCLAAAVLRLLARRSSLFWSIHHSLDSWHQEKPRIRLAVLLLRLLQFFPRRVHFCSNRSAQTHFAKGFRKSKSVLIYNGFDVDRFVPGSASRTSEISDVKVIGHLARFHPMKDHENFIAAVSILSRRRSDFQVIMVGKDVSKENDAIGSLLTRHAPSVEVALRGPLLDVRPIYSQLDALVVSSAWGESFPIVIGEAMSSGVPCIATDVGDSATLVGETGYIVPPRNPDALADAIEKIFDEAGPEKAERRQRCRERIVTRFSIDGIAEKFETLARG